MFPSSPDKARLSAALLAMLLVIAPLTALAQPVEAPPAPESKALATFAGGCFWCMEPPFDKLEGVVSTTSGYMGGSVPDPGYDEVSAGGTGHYEVVQVEYNPDQVSYQTLLETFWVNVDPFDAGGQFCDRGSQYLSAIFVHDDSQKLLAAESKAALAERNTEGAEIATKILPADEFYAAEENHQNYYQEHSIQYNFYRWRCGRDERLKEIWGEGDDN